MQHTQPSQVAQMNPSQSPGHPAEAPGAHDRDLTTSASASHLSLAVVATHPPRKCGIATFSYDLVQGILEAEPDVEILWAAINDSVSWRFYGPPVRWIIRQGDSDSYKAAAAGINASPAVAVSLQHEFGLYGLWGERFEDHLTGFLETLERPLVTTLHTLLPEPSPTVLAAVQRLGERSKAVVVMAELARETLVETYRLDPNKVVVLPHGAPAAARKGRRVFKEKLGLAGRSVITTFGLLDPRKGLEHMIQATQQVVQERPDVLYLIAGKTHPELVRQEGEAYREELERLVETLGLREHVAFVNEYLTQEEIVAYLLASDVYVTPYLDPNQITSGTLAYALGTGKAIVSTPYPHAREVLGRGLGLLVDFRNEAQLAEAVLRILRDPVLKEQLERKAYAYGRRTAWRLIGKRMLDLLRMVATTCPTDDMSQLAAQHSFPFEAPAA